MKGSDSEVEFVPYGEVYGEDCEDMRRRTLDLTKLRRRNDYEAHHDIDSIPRDLIEHYLTGDAGPAPEVETTGAG